MIIEYAHFKKYCFIFIFMPTSIAKIVAEVIHDSDWQLIYQLLYNHKKAELKSAYK